jgi:hypothetical protein
MSLIALWNHKKGELEYERENYYTVLEMRYGLQKYRVL